MKTEDFSDYLSARYETLVALTDWGWAVFPVSWGKKTPATANGFNDASNNLAEVMKRFDGRRLNIGISTGASGLVVIDVDGATGLRSLSEMTASNRIPETFTVATRAGTHIYFQAPPDIEIRCSAGQIAPGIDIRGAGGYVVAATSFVDADKKGPAGHYRITSSCPVAPLPHWLRARILATQQHAERRPAGQTTERITKPETPRNVALLHEQLRFISANCSYEQYRIIIWAILSTNWSCAEQLALEWSKSAPDRFDEQTFHALVRHFDPTREDCPSLGSIYFAARQGGWSG